jgi:hypothetical protein
VGRSREGEVRAREVKERLAADAGGNIPASPGRPALGKVRSWRERSRARLNTPRPFQENRVWRGGSISFRGCSGIEAARRLVEISGRSAAMVPGLQLLRPWRLGGGGGFRLTSLKETTCPYRAGVHDGGAGIGDGEKSCRNGRRAVLLRLTRLSIIDQVGGRGGTRLRQIHSQG